MATRGLASGATIDWVSVDCLSVQEERSTRNPAMEAQATYPK